MPSARLKRVPLETVLNFEVLRIGRGGGASSLRQPSSCFKNSVELHPIHRRIASPAEARTALFEHVEVFDNRRRLHSALG